MKSLRIELTIKKAHDQEVILNLTTATQIVQTMKRNGTKDQQISDKRKKVTIEVRHCLICHEDADFNEDGSSRKDNCIVECESTQGDFPAYGGQDSEYCVYCIICDPEGDDQVCPEDFDGTLYQGPHISNKDELKHLDIDLGLLKRHRPCSLCRQNNEENDGDDDEDYDEYNEDGEQEDTKAGVIDLTEDED